MNIFFKSFVFLIIFSVLHFGYDLTRWEFLKPFCGVDESVFQHLKMAFWAYLSTNIIEYIILKKKAHSSFWYSRFLSTIILPWSIFLVWYLMPALFGKLTSSTLELLWAIFSSYISAIFGGTIEKNIEEVSFNLRFKIFIIALLMTSSLLYILFTYKIPWIDLFVNPKIIKH